MKRGNIVAAAIQGDFGKARPALIVQSDLHRTPKRGLAADVE
jgi:mRNA-degrading endonuclease toxin of MazEF toxin-antitoxin module